MWQILSKRVDVTTLSRSSARFSKTSYMYRILDADDQATDGRTDARMSRLRRTRGCDPRSSTRRARRGLGGNIWNESSKQLECAHTFHSSVFHPSAHRRNREVLGFFERRNTILRERMRLFHEKECRLHASQRKAFRQAIRDRAGTVDGSGNCLHRVRNCFSGRRWL